MNSTEELIKQQLGTDIFRNTGMSGGGCINEGSAYETDNGIVFVKHNSKPEALRMFEGEYESLVALGAADQVTVPKPIKVISNPKGGAMLVMEYIDIHGLSKHAAKLGEQMARLHLHNTELGKVAKKTEQSVHTNIQYSNYVDKFGFSVTTCCGYLPQENNWLESWVDFFARKIEQHVMFAEEKYNDRDARPIWSTLSRNIHKMFQGFEIQPALLHGDLWGGNVGETSDGPIIFDPASFYGHNEYEMAISNMFGGFNKTYFNSYFNILPKQPGYEDRQDLYMMFHYFNHWNHFGGGYKTSTLRILKDLAKKYS
uniref:protein-ribulosamine 3-kinase n=2 Tax=Arion vulgaris TaxID=1028688 RepID=A0A0B7B205_9EUPU